MKRMIDNGHVVRYDTTMRKHNKKPKKKMTPRRVVSGLLIGAGLVLTLFALGYEAVSYPWHIYFKSGEELNADTLPDPAPPVFAPDAVPYEPEEGRDQKMALPGSETLSDFIAGADRDIEYNVLGFLKIPKLSVSVNILEGSEQPQLLLGAGHVTDTPLPDGEGNVCVAGHRVTARMHPLRHMNLMEPGNSVFIHYDGHIYTYETLSVFAVGSEETWVMQPVEGEPRLLTLITCHPPGSARQRLILQARLTRVDGEPIMPRA